MKRSVREIMLSAYREGIVIPAFNIPHLPMVEPVVAALREAGSFGLIQAARVDWEKNEARSTRAVRDEYEKCKDEAFMRLHLDHAPVIDEDGLHVDFEQIIAEAIELGYESVMVDASRLELAENIAAVAKVVSMAHAADVPVEAEIGAVLGHEAGPLPPYEELYASGQGFTEPEQARRLVAETGVDWLSVAIGNVHGAVSGVARSQKKVEARLNIEHLDRIRAATPVPLVLHGGSGIKKPCLLEAFRHGIAKLNIGTTIRQVYESLRDESVPQAQEQVRETTLRILRDKLEIAGSAATVNPQ